ncbi:hypothetical protein [Bacillus sp. UNC41MFS5]|uniref:hypothetical protein n=1 Tax=Bacillus sp. UNC41MFS5 TaxID=1449046 RepID=UPI00047DF9F5|nr:hypothetical protein [Bacillus sp. UNC41MFS5]
MLFFDYFLFVFDVLYDHVFPNLFDALYELKPYESKEEYEIDLVKEPREEYYQVTAKPELVAVLSQSVDTQG